MMDRKPIEDMMPKEAFVAGMRDARAAIDAGAEFQKLTNCSDKTRDELVCATITALMESRVQTDTKGHN